MTRVLALLRFWNLQTSENESDLLTENIKALFRRGKAHIGAWNPLEAKEDFEKVAKLDTTLAAACKKEINHIEEMERTKDEEDKAKLKKLFE